MPARRKAESAMGPENSDEAGLKNIIFLRLPDNFARSIGGFVLDPNIALPVETGGNPERFHPEDLVLESVLAGMLRVLAYRPDHPDADYYRHFVLAMKPDILPELSEAGILKSRNGDLDIAEEIFRALSGLSPERSEPLLNLATVYERRASEYERIGNDSLSEEFNGRAFELYRRLLAFEPAVPEAFYEAAFFHLKNHSYDKARELLETYVRLGQDPERVDRARKIVQKLQTQGGLDTLFKEAFDFIRMGREEEGIAKTRTFLEAYPKVWNGWFLLGWGNRRLGRWAEGREAFEKAIELGAKDADTYNELAICLMELGDFKACRQYLEKALRLEPDNIKIVSNLGTLALRQGKKDEAEGFFRTALELDPKDPVALKLLESLKAEDDKVQ
jgi:tetratricopeptide (TPR) repeat protein